MASATSVRASIDFNGPLNTLSMSPSNKHIAVGGRDGTLLHNFAFSAVSWSLLGLLTNNWCQCSRSWHLRPLGSLRSGICVWASPTSTSAPTTSAGTLVRGCCHRVALQESIRSLLLCSESESLLATAATNGAVVIWNLQREGFKHVQGINNQSTTLICHSLTIGCHGRASVERPSTRSESYLLASGWESAHQWLAGRHCQALGEHLAQWFTFYGIDLTLLCRTNEQEK